MKRQILVLIAVGLLIGADDDKAATLKKEQQKLEGTWAVSSLTQNGMVLPPEQAKSLRLIIKGGKYTMKIGTATADEGTFEIDPTKKPMTLDTKGTIGDKKGIVDPGIYKLEGDTLTTCFGPTGKNRRPTGFASKEGSEDELVVFKRVKE